MNQNEGACCIETTFILQIIGSNFHFIVHLIIELLSVGTINGIGGY